ncbi:unnamed protein product, partial [marine sediment metagenome]
MEENEKWFERAQAEMKEYRKRELFFLKEGFTAEIAAKVFLIALIGHWDAYHLFYYAKRIPQGGTYLEIGCAKGGSLLCAYLATKVSGVSVNFIGIDPNPLPEDFRENTRLIPNFKFINAGSNEVKDRIEDSSVDLLFIDGDHRYFQVKKDIENYSPKVKEGGVLLGHDYQFNEEGQFVKPAVDEAFG